MSIEIPTRGEHCKNTYLKAIMPMLVHENSEAQKLWTQLVTDFMDRQDFSEPTSRALKVSWRRAVSETIKLSKEVAEYRVLHNG